MHLFGKDFSNGNITFIFSIITAGLICVTSPIGAYIQALGLMWFGFILNLGWGMIFIVCTSLLSRYGAAGISGARLIAYIILSILLTIFVLRKKNEGFNGKLSSKPSAIN
jgi:O-antigen/teichoic acid export membrane protein